jgi:hypothetical protein
MFGILYDSRSLNRCSSLSVMAVVSCHISIPGGGNALPEFSCPSVEHHLSHLLDFIMVKITQGPVKERQSENSVFSCRLPTVMRVGQYSIGVRTMLQEELNNLEPSQL